MVLIIRLLICTMVKSSNKTRSTPSLATPSIDPYLSASIITNSTTRSNIARPHFSAHQIFFSSITSKNQISATPWLPWPFESSQETAMFLICQFLALPGILCWEHRLPRCFWWLSITPIDVYRHESSTRGFVRQNTVVFNQHEKWKD